MRSKFLVFVALCASSVAAHAASLTYTEFVIASGSLNNVAFTNQLLTLNLTADTSTVTGSGGLYVTPALDLNGSVANVGSFTIGGVSAFVNQQFTVGGFTDGALGDILDTVNPAFGSYNLQSVFGPVAGQAESSLQTYQTTTGSLRLSSIGSTATFRAVVSAPPPAAVTPEPGSFALLATGLLGAGGVLRRKRTA